MARRWRKTAKSFFNPEKEQPGGLIYSVTCVARLADAVWNRTCLHNDAAWTSGKEDTNENSLVHSPDRCPDCRCCARRVGNGAAMWRPESTIILRTCVQARTRTDSGRRALVCRARSAIPRCVFGTQSVRASPKYLWVFIPRANFGTLCESLRLLCTSVPHLDAAL